MPKKKKTTATSKEGEAGEQQPRAMDEQDQNEGKQENMGEVDDLSPQESEEGEESGKEISSSEHEKAKEEENEGIGMAVEVWTDVLGFIKPIQLAHTVSLTNRQIYKICEPRLHGDKVWDREVGEIVIGRRCTQPATGLLIVDHNREVPFPECPPLDYITGFQGITICFLDKQVLSFFQLICHLTSRKPLKFYIAERMGSLDEEQSEYVNGLLQILTQEDLPNIAYLSTTAVASRFLKNVDNRTDLTYILMQEETDILILRRLLETPRPDGQRRNLHLSCDFDFNKQTPNKDKPERKMVEAIVAGFRAATQPQNFHIACFCDERAGLIGVDGVDALEINELTGETMRITTEERFHLNTVIIRRFPNGQEECAEDVKNKDEWWRYYRHMNIAVEISKE